MAITRQHELVYERLKENYKEVIDENRQLGDRALAVLGAGMALSAFLGQDSIAKLEGGWPVSFSVAVVASVLSILAAIIAWVPWCSAIPRSLDVDKLWDGIIDQDESVAAANMIQDQIGALESVMKTNWIKGIAFGSLILLVGVQAISMLLTACQ